MRLNFVQDVWERKMKDGCSRSRLCLRESLFFTVTLVDVTHTWHRRWRVKSQALGQRFCDYEVALWAARSTSPSVTPLEMAAVASKTVLNVLNVEGWEQAVGELRVWRLPQGLSNV